MNLKILTITLITLSLDQITKIVISLFIELNTSVVIIKNFFYLTYHNNYGAAWGLFSGNNIVLLLASIFGTFIIYRYIATFKENKRNNIAFGLLLAGIAGNMLDRLFIGYVRDFLDFRLFNSTFPVFNVADSAIVIGVALLVIAILKGEDRCEVNSTK